MNVRFFILTTRLLLWLFTILVIAAASARGQNWVPHNLVGNLNPTCIASSADLTKLVVGTGVGYVYTSADSGVTWQLTSASGSNYYLASVVSSADGSRLAAAGGGVIYLSSDSGKTCRTTSWVEMLVLDSSSQDCSNAEFAFWVGLNMVNG